MTSGAGGSDSGDRAGGQAGPASGSSRPPHLPPGGPVWTGLGGASRTARSRRVWDRPRMPAGTSLTHTRGEATGKPRGVKRLSSGAIGQLEVLLTSPPPPASAEWPSHPQAVNATEHQTQAAPGGPGDTLGVGVAGMPVQRGARVQKTLEWVLPSPERRPGQRSQGPAPPPPSWGAPPPAPQAQLGVQQLSLRG